MTRDAPTGFSRVTAGQVIRADRELFTLMAQNFKDLCNLMHEGSCQWIKS